MNDAVRRSGRRAAGILLASIGFIAAISGLIAMLTAASGYDPARALVAVWSGSLGTPYAIASATLVRATPLILTGLAVTLAFNAGVMNIGAEGQLLAGAAACVTTGLALGDWPHWLALPLSL